MDSILDSTVSAYGTVGYSVAVLRGGTLVHARHAGLADRDTGTPVTGRSVYPIFSISKLFLVVELLKAAERGRIDLAMPLRKIRSGLPEAWQEITLAQAIAHVSGLPDYFPNLVTPSVDTVFARLRDRPLRFAPATRNDYNQTNFLLAREALEQATGISLTALVARQLEGAGMRHTGYHTGYPGGTVSLPGLVTSYRPLAKRDGPPARLTVPSWPEYMFASLGVFTTLADMIGWSRALLRGDLLPVEALRASWAPFAMTSGRPASHTHGWEYARHDDVTIVGHGGDNRLAWRHFFRTADPDDCATVIYFDNGGRMSFDSHRVAALLADRVMPGAAGPAEIHEERLYRGLASGHWGEAIAELRAAVSGAGAEAIVNRVGYDALYRFDPHTALLPFGWNARQFPNSSNAHDSLGEAHHAAGNLADARQSYARALALDPGNTRIRTVLNQLASQPPTQ
ncbi:serine hydrolase [Sphingomonas sp. DT-204]|uniref:serine hydrolase n=1 Tax=Sphingomonas sp. DT-204 TaxID=3396166 RepID=UPI003F1D8592